MTNKVNVIGSGRWGTFLAWYMIEHKHTQGLLLYGLESDPYFCELRKTRKNGFLSIKDNMVLTTNLEETLTSEFIIISINAQNLKCLAKEINKFNVTDKTFILAMKGIDIENKKRLSEIFFEEVKQNIEVAVLLGPGHVEDYVRGVPSCAVIDSNKQTTKEKVVELMRSPLMRLYYGVDLIGNEIGGAYKNVIGIAAGILDGLGWKSLKGSLMSRSMIEIGEFIEKCGGNSRSVQGLAFLGDFEATLFSQFSNNRLFGELFIKGETTTKNSEGYYTLKAVYDMSNEFGLEMPITNALYQIIYEKKPICDALDCLFGRDLKDEFKTLSCS